MSIDRKATKQVVEDLDAKLENLSDIASSGELSKLARLRLDVKLRSFVERAEALVRKLDPIHWPRFVFDPGDPAVVCGGPEAAGTYRSSTISRKAASNPTLQ